MDTFVITKALMVYPHLLFEKQDLDTLHLKNLCSFRQALMKKRTTNKIKLTSLVNHAFPELQYFFHGFITNRSMHS